MPLHRRRLLRSACVGIVGGVAGCSSLPTDGGDGDDPQALQFDGAVVDQPSADAPARTEIRIENAGDTELGVKHAAVGASPFEFVSDLSGEHGEVMLLPEQSSQVDVRRGERRREAGCWRVVDGDDGEAYVSFILMAPAVHIPGGETYTARQQVYYHGPADRCLPAGEYRTEVAVEIGQPRGDQNLESGSSIEQNVMCTLRVGQDGRLSLSLS